MTHQVEDENGHIHEFPDDATPEEMNASINRYQASNIVPKDNKSIFPDWLMNAATDINVGRGELLQGLKNFPHNLIASYEMSDPVLKQAAAEGKYTPISSHLPYDERNIAAEEGREHPGFIGKLIQAASHYLFYGLTPAPEIKIAEGLLGVPILGKALKAGFSQMPGGALYGFTQSKDPIVGGLESAVLNGIGGTVLNPLGRAIGLTLGTKNSQKDLAEGILRFARNRSKDLGANTPEQAQEMLSKNYLDENGNPLPIDLGHLINSPSLSFLYGATKFLPWSGAIKNRNIIRESVTNQAVNKAQKDVNAVQEQGKNLKINLPKQPTEMDQELGRQLEDVRNRRLTINSAVNAANPTVNNLLGGVENKGDVVGHIVEQTKNNYKKAKSESDTLYQPINNSKLQLETLGNENRYHTYRSNAVDLLAHRENLQKLFGSDSDLSARLHSEINKAESLTENKGEYSESLPNVVGRVKNLRQLQSAAYKAGSYNEARLLGKLGDSLHRDTLDLLNSSGHEDLANSLVHADANYKNNLVPYYTDTTLRKMVLEKHIPNAATLSKKLYDPNNLKIFGDLPDFTKNAVLNLRLTGGKLAPSGTSSASAEKIALNYAGLDQATRNAIQQHNPEVGQYMESLPGLLEHHANLSAREKSLATDLNARVRASRTQQSGYERKLLAEKNRYETEKGRYDVNLQKALERLEEAKNYKLNAPRESVFHHIGRPTALGALALLEASRMPVTYKALSAVAGMLVPARSIQKVLTSDELRNAYLKGTNLIRNKSLGDELAKRFTAPAITSNLTGNQ